MKLNSEDPKDKYADFVVDMSSKSIGIRLVFDRGIVLANIGQLKQNKKDWHGLSYIVQVYATENIFIYDIPSENEVLTETIKKQLERIRFF